MLFHGSKPVCAHHVQCTLRFLNYSQISSLKYTVCFVDKCCIVQLQIKLVIVVNITKSTQHPDFL